MGVAHVAGSLIITLTVDIPDVVIVPFILLHAETKRTIKDKQPAAQTAGRSLRNETPLREFIVVFLQRYALETIERTKADNVGGPEGGLIEAVTQNNYGRGLTRELDHCGLALV